MAFVFKYDKKGREIGHETINIMGKVGLAIQVKKFIMITKKMKIIILSITVILMEQTNMRQYVVFLNIMRKG